MRTEGITFEKAVLNAYDFKGQLLTYREGTLSIYLGEFYMNKVKRIHILGASGSGTTTLAKKISELGEYVHLDTDDFYWQNTVPKFLKPRSVDERLELLHQAFERHEKWVLSGSLCGWGDSLIPQFDLIVFLRLPHEIRIRRLENRERERYGSAIDKNGEWYQKYCEFMNWAAQYDEGDESVRSLKLHNAWLDKIDGDILRIEEDIDLDEKAARIMERIRIMEL